MLLSSGTIEGGEGAILIYGGFFHPGKMESQLYEEEVKAPLR
jgi:hypothetical protein